MEESKNIKKMSIEEKKSAYDAYCKKFLAMKAVLAYILNGCVEEFEGIEPRVIAEKYIEGEPKISETHVHQGAAELSKSAESENTAEEITGMNTENNSIDDGTVKYDILFYAYAPVSKELIKLIINVEAQSDFHPGYDLMRRAIYYGSRLISSQYNTEMSKEGYDGIKKVYSIWVFTKPPKYLHNTVTAYHMCEKNILGSVKLKKSQYDLMEIITIGIGSSEDENYSNLIKLLDILLANRRPYSQKKDVLKNDYGISLTDKMKKEMDNMCNVSDGIWDEAVEKSTLKYIKNLMQNTNDTLTQILKNLGIPEDECMKYRQLLAEQA